MTRGGRRRRRGPDTQGGTPSQDRAEQARGSSAATPSTSESGSWRRRRRRGKEPKTSALQEMAGGRSRKVATLPPDGVILEDVIASMQQEYGTPSTPQEYRLLLKIPVPDAGGDEGQEESDAGDPAPRAKRGRFRRRGRRSAAASDASGTESGPEGAAKGDSSSGEEVSDPSATVD